MVLRPARDDDLAAMLRWRNHPKVRATSFTTHVIGPGEHARWWEAVRSDPSTRVFVYEHGGTPAGVATYSGMLGGSGSWGYYLDLDGLGTSGALLAAWIGLERAAVEHAFGPLGLTTLRGEVLADNEPVRRLHRRFGFTEVMRYRRRVDGVPREVVVVQLTSEENR